MQLVKPKARTIVVRYIAPNGNPTTTTRAIHFLKGYGYYIRWNKRLVFVDDPAAFVMSLPESAGSIA